jgi:hypothetical protein
VIDDYDGVVVDESSLVSKGNEMIRWVVSQQVKVSLAQINWCDTRHTIAPDGAANLCPLNYSVYPLAKFAFTQTDAFRR